MRIGYERNDYPEIRTIVNKVEGYEYFNIKNNNLYKYILFLKRKLGRLVNNSSNLNLYYSYKSIKKINVDIIHTFNSIVKSNEEFVVTFETICPRYKELLIPQSDMKNIDYTKNVLQTFEVLRSTNCKALIAISESAKNIQEEILSNYPYKEEILKKIIVMHPPQELYCLNLDDRNYQQEIRFIFIGRDFFGKGGEQIIDAFEELSTEIGEGAFKVVIVSSFSNTNTNKPSIEKEKRYKDKLKKMRYIEYYEEMENSKVIELIKKCHVGLLPTWADTYGYSVLEFQACGCPVISTDVRALTEINGLDVGWIINVDKDSRGEAYFATESQQQKLKNDIKNQLKSIVNEIICNKSLIKKKGEKCINRISLQHNPEKYGERLKNIYKS